MGATLLQCHGAPDAVIAIAWKATDQLHTRYRSLTALSKNKQSGCTAVGRELVLFWAIGMAVENGWPTPNRSRRTRLQVNPASVRVEEHTAWNILMAPRCGGPRFSSEASDGSPTMRLRRENRSDQALQ